MVIGAIPGQLDHDSVDAVQDGLVCQFVLFFQMILDELQILLVLFSHAIHAQLAFEFFVALGVADMFVIIPLNIRKIGQIEVEINPFQLITVEFFVATGMQKFAEARLPRHPVQRALQRLILDSFYLQTVLYGHSLAFDQVVVHVVFVHF